jgi:hypothetical protein
MKEPVAGTLKITSTDRVSGAKIVITGVVTAPGMEPTPAQHTVDVPVKKFAAVFRRYDLPVVFDRTDPSRLRFIWDEVPDEKQLDLLEASRVADRMRSGGGTGDQAQAVLGEFGDLGGLLGNLTNSRNVKVYTTTNFSSNVSDLPPEAADLVRKVAEQFGQAFGATNPPGSPNPSDAPFGGQNQSDAPFSGPHESDSMPWDEPPKP